MIDTYEKLWSEQAEQIKKMSICYNSRGVKTCSACDCQRLDIMQHHEFNEPFQKVISKFQQTIEQYKKDCNLYKNQWPKTYRYENLRIKRFLCDTNQQHDTHVDVGNVDTAKRFLAFLVYLNDVEEGGETNFLGINKKLKPKRGRGIIFPPLWMVPHQGQPTISEDKYIFSTYLNYI